MSIFHLSFLIHLLHVSNVSGSLTAHSVNNQSYALESERLQNQNNEILQLRKENEELKDVVQKLKVMVLTIMIKYITEAA